MILDEENVPRVDIMSVLHHVDLMSFSSSSITVERHVVVRVPNVFMSHKVFLKTFGRSQLHHKSVNLSFTITNMKNKLTEFCGN